MKRHFLALLLSLTMIISLLPVTAMANDKEQTPQETTVEEPEEETAKEPQAVTQSAPKALTEAGGELTSGSYILNANVTLATDLTVPADAVVTIDLNGHTLTGTGNGSVIRVAGKLTVLDSGEDGRITGGFKKTTVWKDSDALYNGGGIFVDTDAELILKSGSIIGNDAWNGGGVYINAGGKFTMNGGEISNNNALRPYHGGGGGVYVLYDEKTGKIGKFVMNNGVIKENTTLTQGGGAFISGEMEMNGGAILENEAMKGGGVCINGTMTLNDGVVSGNKAKFLENTEYFGIECGGIKINGGTLNLNGGKIVNNTATSTSEANAKGEEIKDAIAAGIYNVGTLNVSGAPVVSDNTTDGKAQNVYLNSGRVITLSDDLKASAKLYATLDSETGRVTDASGYTIPEDSVLPDAKALTVETHNEDIYFFKNVPVENRACSILLDGVTVYHESLAAAVASLPSDDNVVTLLKDCELTSQVGVSAGIEAILTSEKPVSITWADADTAFFYINKNATLSLQGPITVQGKYKNVGKEISGDTTLCAFDVRGTLNIGEKNADDDLSPVVKNFNTVTVNSSNQPNGGYGAIQAKGGIVNLYSGILKDNVAWYGGAIYATDSGAAVNLVGGEITGNYARYGGGVGAVSEAAVELSGSTIDKNYTYRKLADCELCSSAGGAGIYVATNSTFNMTGGVVKENVATDGVGGGIYLGNHAVGTMSAGSIIDNQATTSNATVASTWVSNEARGAGVFISYATFTMEDGLISGNQLVDKNGNNASVSGGGVVVSGTTSSGKNVYAYFTMNGGTISRNSSTKMGGGVYITGPTKVTLTGGKITENTASIGGGVYVTASNAGGEELHMSGSPYIAQNTTSDVLLSGSNTVSGKTFPARVITIDSALESGANIGVRRADSTTAVAEAATGYTVTAGDAAYFVSTNSKKLIQKSETDNRLVLADKGSDTSTITIKLPDNVTVNRAPTSTVKNGTYQLTFTPKEGYAVDTVKNGEDVLTPENGVYTVTVTGDTTITVTEKALPVKVDPKTAEMNGVYGEYMEEALEVTATYALPHNVKSFATSGELPAGLKLSTDGVVFGTPEAVTDENGVKVTVKVTAQNGTTDEIELTVKIAKAEPELSINAAPDSLRGGGKVTLTVTGAPEEGNVTVTCDNGITVTGNESAVLPNRTATYTFTANYEESKNYTAASAKCEVSVTRRASAPSATTPEPEPEPDDGLPFTDVAKSAYFYDAVEWAVGKEITDGMSATMFGPYESCTRAQIVTFLWRAAGSPEPKTVSSFSDVPASAYYTKAVAWAVENGITNGMTETEFSPNATCTRGQSVTFLYRALKGTASGSANFTDVPANAFYADAVNWAVANNVTNGTSATTFSPNADCTRAEIVTFLYRAYQGK